ncbi:hypothetical protein Tco_0323246 [Tanacetum coccineum]
MTFDGTDYYDAYLEKVVQASKILAGEEVTPKAATKKSSNQAPHKPKEKNTQSMLRKPLMQHRSSQTSLKSWEKGGKRLIRQWAIEESLKDAHGAPRGPLPPVVFRETNTGKFQQLPEVEGKGKEKVGAEQAAQRRTSAPTEPSGHDKSSSLYAELGLTESDTESDEEMPLVVESGAQDEGRAGTALGIQDKGQVEPNPDDVVESQPLSTPGVHAGPNLEHTDVEATEATSQSQPIQMDEEFTTTAYPNVQENLKLTVDEPVIPEEPASSTGTLSSL